MCFLFSLMLLAIAPLQAEKLELSEPLWNGTTGTATLSFTLKPEEILYKDHIQIISDSPELTVTEWKASRSPSMIYDKTFKDTKASFSNQVDMSISLKHSGAAAPATLHVQYRLSNRKEPQEKLFPLTLPATHEEVPAAAPASVEPAPLPQTPPAQHITSSVRDTIIAAVQKVKIIISQLVERTDSLLIRFIAVFVLGILMSLTPCIYPMIPITVGILQTSAGRSLFKNFLLAGCYTLGMATTFACLGLLAATGSAQFGELMGNKIFVCILVAILAYLAGSMLDLYDLYIPRFLQPKNQQVHGGSYLSVFIFGALSGSVASPCLSPGLLLLLSIVATLGNKLLGFALLFFFGLGLGLPLLIIGTFSNSMNLLPQAGMWMIEVKKLFGLMLLGMCFYYLSNIMPLSIVLMIAAITLFALGLYIILSIVSYESVGLKRYKYLLAIILMSTSFVLGFKSVYHTSASTEKNSFWLDAYDEAHDKALREHKLLFVDCGALWCTSCKEVERTITHTKEVEDILAAVVAVYVDCTQPHAVSCSKVQKQFNVIGFPALLLIDPQTDQVLGRWSSEVLERGADAFARELSSLIK